MPEHKSTVGQHVRWIGSLLPAGSSDFDVAKILVRTLQTLLIFIFKDIIYRIKVSQKYWIFKTKSPPCTWGNSRFNLLLSWWIWIVSIWYAQFNQPFSYDVFGYLVILWYAQFNHPLSYAVFGYLVVLWYDTSNHTFSYAMFGYVQVTCDITDPVATYHAYWTPKRAKKPKRPCKWLGFKLDVGYVFGVRKGWNGSGMHAKTAVIDCTKVEQTILRRPVVGQIDGVRVNNLRHASPNWSFTSTSV